MILKIPWTDKKDHFTYIDNIERVTGPKLVLWSHEDKRFNEAESGEAADELADTFTIFAADLEKPCLMLLYRRRGAQEQEAVIFDEKLYLMNDEGKTIEVLR